MTEYLDQYGTLALWLQTLIALAALVAVAGAVNWLLKRVLLRFAAPYLDTDRHARSRCGLAGDGDPAADHLARDRAGAASAEAVVTVVVNVVRALIVLSVAWRSAGRSITPTSLCAPPRSPQPSDQGLYQVVKIAVFCGAAILMIAVLIEQSPLLLLSGLGAMAAVLLLVFKDTILSLVASVQLTSNDMLRVGDWIEMPSMDADGDVVDIALHTVKVQNFDKTITTIPTHKLIADSFRNWRGMTDSGGSASSARWCSTRIRSASSTRARSTGSSVFACSTPILPASSRKSPTGTGTRSPAMTTR